MIDSFDYGAIERATPYLAEGMRYTLELTAAATVGGIIFGTLLALLRLQGGTLGFIAKIYVNVMRAIPLLVVVFFFYLMLPLVIQKVTHTSFPPRSGADKSAYVTFIMFEAAYFCEVVRAGIGSVAHGQSQAARALGMRYFSVMRFVILPQALRSVLPIAVTQVVVLFQDVSLVSLLNVTDFVGAATQIAQRDGRIIEMYMVVAIVYFFICFTVSCLARMLHARVTVIR